MKVGEHMEDSKSKRAENTRHKGSDTESKTDRFTKNEGKRQT